MIRLETFSKGYFDNINEFKLLQDIGIGSFGKVKLAIHKGTRKQYAIKIIDLKGPINQTEMGLIMRQIKIHSQLDHPHIIKLWDIINDDSNIYLIMEYAQKGSLFNYHSAMIKKRTPLPPAQIYKFFYQTLQALKYLHKIDIMHRDVKPENLLLDQNFNIKLCDFGWATSNIMVPRSTFCGTYQYMAPEMILQKSYNYQIDVWALGILLYELIHGKAPFQAENVSLMKQLINKGSYQISSFCSDQLKNLLIRILQFIPDNRLKIKQIQCHEWVKSCQNISFEGESSVFNEKISIFETKKMNSKQKEVNNIKAKKALHQQQKSVGNIDIQERKKFEPNCQTCNLTFEKKQQKKSKKGDESNCNNTELLGDENVGINFRKHKRNITEPVNFQQTKMSSHENANKMKTLNHAMSKEGLKIKSYQMYSNSNSNSKAQILTNLTKMRKIHKSDDKLIQAVPINNCNYPSQKIKPSINIKTEIGPQISGNLSPTSPTIGHKRNFSNRLKEREEILETRETIKKKEKDKDFERANLKLKNIEDKVHQISNKLAFKKSYKIN